MAAYGKGWRTECRPKKLKDKKIDIIVAKGGYIAGEGVNSVKNKLSPAPIWAYYRQLSGDEKHAASAIGSIEEAMFVINWRNDIDTSMAVEFRGVVYDIVRIDDFEGYKKDLTLICRLAKIV